MRVTAAGNLAGRAQAPGARRSARLLVGSSPSGKTRAYGGSFDMMIVPEAANMPPTPWQTEILAPGIWASAVPRIWRTLSSKGYMPYIREGM